MSKQIPLSQGKFAIVDDDAFDFLNQWKWCYCNSGYAIRSDYTSGVRVFVLMHRFILDAPKGMYVDHVDHNGLNNQRNNIRIATPSENHYNMRASSSEFSSKYKGVFYARQKQKWAARIHTDKQKHFLGYFNTELEAAQAYNLAATLSHGNFALPNDLSNHVETSLPVKRKRSQTSKFKGVSFDPKRKRWFSYAMIDYKKRHLGQFVSETDAARAYDAFVKEHNLDRPLNFPE